jgi:small subunit ribosomal protein S17e
MTKQAIKGANNTTIAVTMRLNEYLGKVRPEKVKKTARELVKRFPDKFTTDFESNKKVLKSVASIYSTKLTNLVAGYITRLVAISKAAEAEESAEGTEEEAEESEETD